MKARFGSAVPIVLVSDLPREELERRARSGKADAFISKALNGKDFVEFVRNICAITYSPEALPQRT